MKHATRLIERREFSCVAEAVAHYAQQGMETPKDGYFDDYRIMRGVGNREVMIRHRGFLDVVATLIETV